MPIWKPGTRKGAVYLTPIGGDAPTVTTSTGKTITLIPGNKAGGSFYNEGNYQWVLPKDNYSEVVGDKGLKLTHNGQTGVIGNGSSSYRGDNLNNWQESSKGAVGTSGNIGSTTTGIDPRFNPGIVGENGFVPANVAGDFPDPAYASFSPVTTPDYNLTDPLAFAKKAGEINRAEIIKNNGLAKSQALDQLGTELKGLEGFAPAASALKRNETSIDNVFNSAERSKAVDANLPGVKDQLNAQGQRAETYASGRSPDSIADAGLELNSRSKSADSSSTGGFGATSSVAKKDSDLRAADERINLSKYGDALLTSNITQKSNVLLPPTEYSDAGTQIKVTPTLSGAQLQSNAQAQIDSNTLINPTNALASKVQQEQFKTGLQQTTDQFNANGKFSESQINANTKNAFSLKLFDYISGYAGAVASGAASNNATEIALDQQKRIEAIYRDQLGNAQQTDQIKAITNGITTAITTATGLLLAGSSGSSKTTSTGATSTGTGPTSLTGTGTPSILDASSTTSPVNAAPNTSGGNDSTYQLPTNITNPDNFGNSGTDVSSPSFDSSGGFDLNAESAQLNTSPAAFSETLRTLKSVPGGENLNDKQAAQLMKGANVALDTLGVHNEPAQGTTAQLNSNGRPVYIQSQTPQVANNTGTGSAFINTVHGVLDPTGVFSKDDSSTIDKIATASNDAAFAEQLTTLAQRGDQQGFITALGSRVAPSIINQTGLSSENKAGLQAAATAASVFQNWQNMSPAQRSLAVAQIGLQGFHFASGENLASKVIPGTTIANGPSLTVGDSLGLLSQGYNVYGLVNNWDQLNTIQKATGGVQTAAGIAQTAQHLGLIGTGAGNAAVAANVTELANNGYQISSAYGIGALSGPSGASIPNGYSVVSQETGKQIIMPTANASSSALTAGADSSTAAASADVAATAAQAPSVAGSIITGLGYVAAGASIAVGAKTIYDGWGKNDGSYHGPLNGAIGGASIGAGLTTLTGGAAAPLIVGGAVAGALLNSWGTSGKSIPQQGRDLVRDMFVESGFADKNGAIKLADGSTANIGVDGHGDERNWTNPALAGELGKRKLHPYDTDFTNQLDFMAGMQGTALTRLKAGGTATHIEQVGRQLGNASLGKVGYGKELSESNFNYVRDNMRLNFARNGITSLKDGYALNNQGFAERRFTDLQHLENQQALDMVFKPDGFKFATQLAQGHEQGVKSQVPKNEKELENLQNPPKAQNTVSLFKKATPVMSPNEKRAAVKKAVMGPDRKNKLYRLRA